MGYSVKILLDSVSESGARLTSFELQYPRFIHAELMTHRVFSRNSASSRAIPVDKMIQKAIDDPAMPLSWGTNKPGMSAGPELTGTYASAAKRRWLEGRDAAVRVARDLSDWNVHKQIANRVLEPYLFHTVILSGTTFENFFEQRCHAAAQPEIQFVANEMRRALATSHPTVRLAGEWHMPFMRIDDAGLSLEDRKRVSVARCARVSYENHDGERSVADDLRLFTRLALATPPHLSPLEHVATPGTGSGNFAGWNQFRHILEL